VPKVPQKPRASQAAEKLVKYVSKRRIVSGHDFSRAKSAAKINGL